MAEQKVITRELPNVSPKEAVEKILELAQLAEGLLDMPEWRNKTIAKVQLTFETEFFKPEKSRLEEKYKLKDLRNHTLGFGKHEGERLDDIPLSYLEYLYESGKELQEMLKFYLFHPTVKQEREDE